VPDRLGQLSSSCSRPLHHSMIMMMRITLNLPDDIYEIARSLAEARRISLGDAIATLVAKD
jgi:hypothetical protein